jgi:protein O-GlcNAc transferase
MNIDKEQQLALKHYQAGNLQQAKPLIEKILKLQPNNGQILHILGLIYYELENYDLAIENLTEALLTIPNNEDIYYDLGNVFQEKGQVDEALTYYLKVLQLNSKYVNAYNNMGIIYQDKGQIEKAIATYQNALQIDGNSYILNNNIGFAFQEKGQFDEALKYYQKAIQLNPYYADAFYNIGNIYGEKGQFDEAITCFQKALQINPSFTEAYCNIGNVYREKGQFDEAITCFQKALQINPHFVSALLNLGITLRDDGNWQEAITAYDKAIDLKLDYIMAHWDRCISLLPIIYTNQSNIRISRSRYYNELIKLQKIIPLKTQQDIEDAGEAVGSMMPFFLAYQGMNDKDLQQIYGNLVCKIMSLRYPQFANCPTMPSYLAGEPLRVGFISGFFYLHSNWKIPIKGWIENIDKKRFDLYGYYTGKIKDEATEDAKLSFTRFIDDIYSFEELCKAIRKDNLHVLIYPEVGMDPMALRLAALRLSPIQCTSWGHPETSGFPTIDYFLSSDLMEPDDADDHYTEKLIRLPNLSIYYAPLDFPPADINRETFGIRQKSVLYLCCQSLFKYLPQYDEIYPRIAKEVGDCQFLFISHKSSYVTEQFRMRIYQSFEKFSLRADDYVVFLPQLDTREYNAINSLSNIYLDSIGWSGCNSTFEALAYNLPVVTLPGNLMRGRHSAAILNMMGTTDTMVSILDEYIELAVRLGLDSELRKQISERVAANKHLIYRDKTCIIGLENFLEKAVTEKLQ